MYLLDTNICIAILKENPNILPLLKNGTTPENQTILTVLEDIAERVGDNSWRLKREGQLSLF